MARHINASDSSKAVRPGWTEAVIPKYRSQDDKVSRGWGSSGGRGGTSRLFASLTPQLVALL